jgi:hypothetical protein
MFKTLLVLPLVAISQNAFAEDEMANLSSRDVAAYTCAEVYGTKKLEAALNACDRSSQIFVTFNKRSDFENLHTVCCVKAAR